MKSPRLYAFNFLQKINHFLNSLSDKRTYSQVNSLSMIVIFTSGMLIGLIYGLFTLDAMFDQDSFKLLGEQFANNNNFGSSVRRGPVYPFLLGMLFKLFGNSNLVIIVFHSFILGLLGMIGYLISIRLSRSWKVSAFAGLLIIIHPMDFLYTSKILVELVFALLFLIMSWFAYRSVQRMKYIDLILFGISTALAALCKSVVFLFPLFLGGTTIILSLFKLKAFSHLKSFDLLKLLVIPTVFMLITLSPWTYRNYLVSDSFILISEGVGYEFLRGNYLVDENAHIDLKIKNTEVWDKFENDFVATMEENNITSMEERNAYLDSCMKDYIVSNPGKVAIKAAKQIPMFWMRGGTLEKSIIFLALSILTLALYIIGFYPLRRQSAFPYIVLMLLIYMNLLHALILAIARYSMPMYPLLIISGTYGLSFLVKKNIEELRRKAS